jgi:hypothetical protein
MASIRNADDDEPGPEYDAELLTDVSADECTADTSQDQKEEYRRNRLWQNRSNYSGSSALLIAVQLQSA